MADFRPVESNKAHILTVRAAPQGTSLDDANAEWVEVIVDEASDMANWRLQHLRGFWRTETAKPVEWEWVYTWGSPTFVRAAGHPLADDVTPGRIHVYAAGPAAAARLLWQKGDYVRLVDAFGTVIDEVVVWTTTSDSAVAGRSGGA